MITCYMLLVFVLWQVMLDASMMEEKLDEETETTKNDAYMDESENEDETLQVGITVVYFYFILYLLMKYFLVQC